MLDPNNEFPSCISFVCIVLLARKHYGGVWGGFVSGRVCMKDGQIANKFIVIQ